MRDVIINSNNFIKKIYSNLKENIGYIIQHVHLLFYMLPETE